MRTLVFGDLHGGLQALRQLLRRANISKADHLIFLGDYVDGWSEAFETVEFLIQLGQSHHCTFIRGNHDELCKEWLISGEAKDQWLIHGGEATRKSYSKVSKASRHRHIAFFESLENYRLDNDNRLFLHAGFTNLKGIDFEYFPAMFYWDRTLWELAKSVTKALKMEDPDFPNRLKIYNEIYIGHTPLSKTEVVLPQLRACVWNMDTGAAFKGALSAMDIDTKEVFQSDAVQELYPKEKGRN